MSNATAPVHSPVTVNRPDKTKVGIIVWLSSELMFFAGLFAMYFTHQAVAGPEAWQEGYSTLALPFSIANTTVLILSSITAQMGANAAERFQPSRSGSIWKFTKWGMQEWIILTFLMGSFFVAGQVYEFAELTSHGLTLQSSSYGSVFYLLTGFHGLHVIGGLIAFLFVLLRSFNTHKFGHREASFTVAISFYWHFVDAVWILMFFIIYIMPML